jgi:predicted enzyme related to lactoylglutathione lyase
MPEVAQLKIVQLIIDVQVRDLERAVDFYQDILGLPIIQKEKDWASFEAAGAEIHLYTHGGTECGVEFRVSVIEREVEKLRTKGVQFEIDRQLPNFLRAVSDEVMEFPWGKMAFFRDSEGNQLVLVEDA